MRSEAAIDTESRLFYAIAEVLQTALKEEGGTPFLEVGLFVSAEIESREYTGVTTLPRSALYEKNTLLSLDEKNSLKFIQVDVLQSDAKNIVVHGLSAGQKIITDIPGYVVEGMHFEPGIVGATPDMKDSI